MREFNKIFGIGLNRAGTSSLHQALNRLGIPSFHDASRLYEQMELNNRMELPLLTGLEEYRAFSDHPCDWEFKRLDEEYPDSLFIYTQRDLEPWIESMKFLHRGRKIDEDVFTERHEKHFKDVLGYFKDRKSDLLIIRICEGEGWNELCEFLEIDPPEEPFPHIGSRV